MQRHHDALPASPCGAPSPDGRGAALSDWERPWGRPSLAAAAASSASASPADLRPTSPPAPGWWHRASWRHISGIRPIAIGRAGCCGRSARRRRTRGPACAARRPPAARRGLGVPGFHHGDIAVVFEQAAVERALCLCGEQSARVKNAVSQTAAAVSLSWPGGTGHLPDRPSASARYRH
jgi:hypothetical protein